MAEGGPSKNDIQTIFKKLRAIPTNKACFDCNAKNPTWSSVTYGVFICIDCSAVHRSLGVHLTFVRSTQLDTNWTWLQLRQMQLGGNANASVFFRQHNCNTSDAQQKYTSRAAQLYKEKLNQASIQAMRLHGTKLHIDAVQEKPEESAKEVDFFEEHVTAAREDEEDALEGGLSSQSNHQPALPVSAQVRGGGDGALTAGAPRVALSSTEVAADPERKSIIGGRKPAARKQGLGAKKGGLGAQRVQTNFAELEREAEMMDKMKEREAEEARASAERSVEEEQKAMASMRLAYKDLSLQQRKEEEKMKQIDPRKAEQVERLGMGFSARSAISHSALGDMKTIEQETPLRAAGSKAFDSDNGDDLDDYAFVSSNLSMYMSRGVESKALDGMFLDRGLSRGGAGGVGGADPHRSAPKDFSSMKGWSSTSDSMAFASSFDEKPAARQERGDRSERSERPRREPVSTSAAATPSGEAQKKFGNAKAISSDQFFGDSNANNWERKANLSRFEGSSSISSADYFGDGRPQGRNQGLTTSLSAPDLDDVKESVRQGVTKVAGKISSLANGVLSSIQDRYGY